MKVRPMPLRRALTLGLCTGLAGCSTLGNVVQAVAGLGPPRPFEPEWDGLLVVASDDANGNSPVALDLVFVREQALLDVLLAMPAARWFSTRKDTQRSFPGSLSLLSLEVVPSQRLALKRTAFAGRSALAVVAFASYPPPGEHRARLSPKAPGYLIQLGSAELRATETTTGSTTGRP